MAKKLGDQYIVGPVRGTSLPRSLRLLTCCTYNLVMFHAVRILTVTAEDVRKLGQSSFPTFPSWLQCGPTCNI